ncbi:transglycosylase SLT domain-containing protein [Thiothrix lacustris]|uniref:transglycosylase SLT domain-containing protein n=1 Tax=Thiothrix lacustris TaxID=525917 RepID=UPI0006851C1E|nr:transglycosylase SLT domain-containing protein [Thiothrix lacustris]
MNKSVFSAASIALTAALIMSVNLIPNTAYAAGCQTLSSDNLQERASAYQPAIQTAASQHGVSASLIKAVITVESCFRSKARGSLGEKGLMQLMPATARRFNISNGYSPQQNIHGGARYLGLLLQRYDGSVQHTVAAYNAGEGNVKPNGRIPNKSYVSKVLEAYGKFSGKGEKVASATLETTKKQPVTQKAAWNKPASHGLPWADLPTTSSSTYTVKAGDTVYAAMRNTGINAKRIIRLNGLSAPYAIKAGQVLRLH